MTGLEWLKFIDITKIPLKWWAIINIFFLSLVSLPDTYASILGIVTLRAELRPYLGIIALLSFAILLVNSIIKIYMIFSLKKKKLLERESIEEKKSKIIASLDKLSVYEASILMTCYQNNQQTINLRIDDAYVRSLVDKKLMKRISGYGDMLDWPHTVNDFIWDHIPSLSSKFTDMQIKKAFDCIG